MSSLVSKQLGISMLNKALKLIRQYHQQTVLELSQAISLPKETMEGANKRGNSSRLTQSFHFFMFEPIFSPVNALNQPI